LTDSAVVPSLTTRRRTAMESTVFHMNYSMDVQDKRILKLKPGSYATPVLFQLLPR